MAKFCCLIACALLVAAVSGQRGSPNRENVRDTVGSGSNSDNWSKWTPNRDFGSRDFGFDRGGGSRAGSAARPSNRWGDDDEDSENDFSTPTITPWTDGVIPYEIDPEISTGNAAALKRMFQDISDKTCVQFRQKRFSDKNYLSIKSGTKCSAPLGMMTGSGSLLGSRSRFGSSSSSGTVSNVILGRSCFTTKRVGRRVMNLLGIPHETSRPDRDQYVEINMANLRRGYTENIKQVARSAYLPGVLDVSYDPQSITQYTDDDLARDSNTWGIRLKGRSTRSQTLGGESFSTLDFEKIRKAYGCSSRGSGGARNRAL